MNEQNINIEKTPEIKVDEKFLFNFSLNVNELYLIGAGLGKLPYESVKELIEKIQTEMNIQVSSVKQS